MVVEVKGLKIKIIGVKTIWSVFSHGNMVQLKKNIQRDMENSGVTGTVVIEWLSQDKKKMSV